MTAPQFSLEQFEAALRIKDPAGLPYIIIGGQAVNYWATRYIPDEPALAVWQPFTSKDLDFCGNRADVKLIAAALDATPQFPHKKLMTAFAGAIPWRVGAEKTNVEVIRQVPGVSTHEINKFAVQHQYPDFTIRVIDATSLLICKLRLTLTVDQTNRRDGQHAQILLICVRAFLREVLVGVEAGDLPARGWLGATERVLKLAESVTGAKAARQLGVNWLEALPQSEIAASTQPVVAQFREQRLPQWLAKMGRRKLVKRP